MHFFDFGLVRNQENDLCSIFVSKKKIINVTEKSLNYYNIKCFINSFVSIK